MESPPFGVGASAPASHTIRAGLHSTLQPKPCARGAPKQVEISVEDVVLLACMREEPDADAHERREMVHKRMRLDAEEALRKLRESAQSRAAMPAESLLSRLGRAVIDNIRFTLVRLHLRYEHPAAGGACGFACGATLQRLEVSSTDAGWRPEDGEADAARPEVLGRATRTRRARRSCLRRVTYLNVSVTHL